jgi:hypothetical protein
MDESSEDVPDEGEKMCGAGHIGPPIPGQQPPMQLKKRRYAGKGR